MSGDDFLGRILYNKENIKPLDQIFREGAYGKNGRNRDSEL